MTWIVLTPEEVKKCCLEGMKRQYNSIVSGKVDNPTHGEEQGNAWQRHIDGALSEYAYAKLTGREWTGAKVAYGDDIEGGIEVKCIHHDERERKGLLIRPVMPDHQNSVLMIGWNDTWEYAGWYNNGEAKKDCFYHKGQWGRPPCFVVPIPLLHR